MKRKFATMTAGLATLALSSLGIVPAKAVSDHTAAIKACSAVNPAQPVSVLSAVDDGSGIGFSLVWITDNNGHVWMCDADDQGKIYAYSALGKDLLSGSGPELIGLQLASDGTYDGQSEDVAAKVCVAYLKGDATVVHVSPDGLDLAPGFIVFVKDGAGHTYLCNATGDAAVWAFAEIGEPLALDGKTVTS
jgi:hypothetical protein